MLKTAQEIILEVDPIQDEMLKNELSPEFEVVEVVNDEPFLMVGEDNEVLDVLEEDSSDDDEVYEESVPEIEIIVSDLPGAPPGTEDPVIEEETKEDKHSSEPKSKWDWQSKGFSAFLPWIKERLDNVPSHSGYDLGGLNRSIAYLEKLDGEISRAMRSDLDGELNSDKIEDIRAQIEKGISALTSRISKVEKSKKKKASYEPLTKIAQKSPGVHGIYIMAPLFISRLARVCINGCITAGRDISDDFRRQVDKWKLTDREQAELVQLLEDMGFPIRNDRGFKIDEEMNASNSDNFEWAQQFQG